MNTKRSKNYEVVEAKKVSSADVAIPTKMGIKQQEFYERDARRTIEEIKRQLESIADKHEAKYIKENVARIRAILEKENPDVVEAFERINAVVKRIKTRAKKDAKKKKIIDEEIQKLQREKDKIDLNFSDFFDEEKKEVVRDLAIFDNSYVVDGVEGYNQNHDIKKAFTDDGYIITCTVPDDKESLFSETHEHKILSEEYKKKDAERQEMLNKIEDLKMMIHDCIMAQSDGLSTAYAELINIRNRVTAKYREVMRE